MKFLLTLLLLASCSQKYAALPEVEAPSTPEVTHAEPQYTTTSKLAYLQKTASLANCVLTKQGFYDEVVSSKFTHTDKTSNQVAEDLAKIKVVVKSYTTSKFSIYSVNATTYKSDPGSVYFNTRNNPRSDAEMLNTALHEGTHTIGYSHGDNSPKGKENSVPYKVGTIASKYINDCKEN